jgi:hypothetical protein
MLGQDEAWLEGIVLELEPEDGRLYVGDLDDDDVVTAFTPFGVENLEQLVEDYKRQAAVRRRRVATPRASPDAYLGSLRSAFLRHTAWLERAGK